MKVDFGKCGGLVPVIAQDVHSGEVLMLAYMNEAALQKTLETGKATYFSRSKNRLWVKGESSGHEQEVKEIRVDCDGDTLLLRVVQKGGAACHTGYASCFHHRIQADGGTEVLGLPVFDPEKVYGK
ncbi:phosphoribosyl-AMP cyclohydrolase [Desulfobotulus sp. H1]|uniref:Phosphoribosyl-AMP cyclohydrolase n=1 Tax=Desulfobotulus pelophilus TaxID=2823377 RepID=A0ABT3NBQ3_9BACT|nr:phosphoribosyl-AMP cyclohydrolase [Desulfobotulus pelophilus]MCW7754606.1 phosphoribosyl-AMP cyclohydrolase [Desulfobotulus pelophilus]